ncbi:MAG TPA: hypothetical protein VFV05_08950 [Methylomirabilota bacterium]|nr:hypothetical protein [Methylomirabilota bacterium]
MPTALVPGSRRLAVAALTALAALAGALVPGLAAACQACLSSPYGDRTYNVAYIGLLLMPFAIGLVIGAVLVWSAGYRLDVARLRRAFARNVTLKETP